MNRQDRRSAKRGREFLALAVVAALAIEPNLALAQQNPAQAAPMAPPGGEEGRNVVPQPPAAGQAPAPGLPQAGSGRQVRRQCEVRREITAARFSATPRPRAETTRNTSAYRSRIVRTPMTATASTDFRLDRRDLFVAALAASGAVLAAGAAGAPQAAR